MLLTVQVPVVDVRPLLGIETGRHPYPTFPSPDRVFAARSPEHHHSSFVPGLGAVRPRLKGGAPPWPSERYYIDARSTIRVARPPARPGYVTSPTPTFRNFYTDGVVGRLELGFRWEGDSRYLVGMQNAVLKTPARLARQPREAAVPCGHFGAPFARHVLRSTTQAGHADPEQWWIQSGIPTVVTEFPSTGEVIEASMEVRDVDLPGRIDHRWGHVAGVRASFWSLTQGDAGTEQFYRLRVHLSRLHTDFTVLAMVLAMCAAGRLDANAAAVEDYLVRTSSLLCRERRHGFAQRELIADAYRAAQGAYGDVLETLDHLGPHLGSERLRSSLFQLTRVAGAPAITIDIQELVMHKYESNMYGDNYGALSTGSGDAVVNNASAADISRLLGELADAVAQLHNLSDENRMTVEDTIEGLHREIQDNNGQPDRERVGSRLRRILQITGESGTAGTAVAALIAAIQAALGIAMI